MVMVAHKNKNDNEVSVDSLGITILMEKRR